MPFGLLLLRERSASYRTGIRFSLVLVRFFRRQQRKTDA
jgi:hypothetical protein